MSTDPIDQLFDQAIKDCRREDVCEHWPNVLRVLIHSIEIQRSMREHVSLALDDLEISPTAAELTPREYERLVLSLERMRDCINEFHEAWQAVEKNMARWQEDSTT